MWLNNELNIYWNFHQAKFSKAFHIASVKPVVLLFSCIVFTVFRLPVIKLVFLVYLTVNSRCGMPYLLIIDFLAHVKVKEICRFKGQGKFTYSEVNCPELLSFASG